MYKKCQADVQKMSGRYTKNVRQVYKKCQAGIQKMSGDG